MLCIASLALALPLAALKADFRLASARADRGFAASADTTARLQSLAAEIEAACEMDATPTADSRLLGKWTLDFCDAGDVLGVALLPLPPGARIGDIYQEVAASGKADGSFEVQNGVTFAAPLVPTSPSLVYEVEARCSVLDQRRVQLVFVGGRVRPPLNLPPLGATLPDAVIGQLSSIIGERIFLETTYLDDDFRVARGPGRELYVLSKREALSA